MRFSWLVLLACGGGPAFVPLRVEVTSDPLDEFVAFVVVTKKLNPACESNCEMARAIEDGGCGRAIATRTGGTCEGSGSQYIAVQRGWGPGGCDGGACLSGARMVAVDAEVEVEIHADAVTDCRSKHSVRGDTTIAVVLPTCAFSSRNP